MGGSYAMAGLGAWLKLWKQIVVLEVDVFDQVLVQACGACIQCLPCVACPTWRLMLRGEFGQSFQLRAMADVFVTHHADGMNGHGVLTQFEKWEQDGLFFRHVF